MQLADPADHGKTMALVDGGVFANNPGMCGFVDRTTVRGQADDVLMVSLGTGRLTKKIPYGKAKHWGLFGWGRHIMNVVFDGVTESVEYELGQVLTDYHRLQVSLKPEQDPMDKPANVGSLIALAEKLVEKETDEIDKIVAKLLGRKSGSGAAGGPGGPARRRLRRPRTRRNPASAGQVGSPEGRPGVRPLPFQVHITSIIEHSTGAINPDSDPDPRETSYASLAVTVATISAGTPSAHDQPSTWNSASPTSAMSAVRLRWP